MKALVQRVDHASVSVDGEVIGQIGAGLLVLVGAGRADTGADAEALARKVVGLRIFPDEDGRFNRSLIDSGGAMLVVSQFTLYADVRRGRRPSFTEAARPEQAEQLVEEFVEAVRALGVEVETGRFGAMMEVDLRNNGPFTLMVETAAGRVV
ncbi:MAG: D-tyrosyl-tRNA(Tyr) deacylase [Acidimicrobiia bacterium]|nr:D-tyrosyl-tRNA(Tyr) deacylase [Acidimicrobiia bacterium]MYF83887.1 D-tyrosyl-tRNA(Tyr) deacylase [Acidimicrobiia bacterium]